MPVRTDGRHQCRECPPSLVMGTGPCVIRRPLRVLTSPSRPSSQPGDVFLRVRGVTCGARHRPSSAFHTRAHPHPSRAFSRPSAKSGGAKAGLLQCNITVQIFPCHHVHKPRPQPPLVSHFANGIPCAHGFFCCTRSLSLPLPTWNKSNNGGDRGVGHMRMAPARFCAVRLAEQVAPLLVLHPISYTP